MLGVHILRLRHWHGPCAQGSATAFILPARAAMAPDAAPHHKILQYFNIRFAGIFLIPPSPMVHPHLLQAPFWLLILLIASTHWEDIHIDEEAQAVATGSVRA